MTARAVIWHDVENGAYAGTIKTLTLNVKATIKPCDRDSDKAPDYRVTATTGPAHAPTFEVAVSLGDLGSATATGGSKRAAEQAAAEQREVARGDLVRAAG